MECPRCEGSGVCVDCRGSGWTSCPTCEGAGQRKTSRGLSYNCKTCGGEGQIECPKTCASCGGSGSITEELQKAVREKYTVRFANMTPLSKATGVLLAVNILIFFAAWAPLGDGSLSDYLINTRLTPETHEWWRFVTPMFLHWSWWHLGLNMWFLYSFGPQLEGVYGTSKFVVFYLLTGLAGNIASFVGLCVIGNHYVAGAGASGALFGVAAAFIGLHHRFGLFRADTVRSWTYFLVGYLVVGFASSYGGFDFLSIDNWAHLGGFLSGLALVWLTPKPTGR